jgi:hypothetical protein
LTTTQVWPALVHLPWHGLSWQRPSTHSWPDEQLPQARTHWPMLQYSPLTQLTPVQGSGWQVAGNPLHTFPAPQLPVVHMSMATQLPCAHT